MSASAVFTRAAPTRFHYRQVISKIAIQHAKVNPLAQYRVGAIFNQNGITGIIALVNITDDLAMNAVIVELEIQP